MNLPRRAKTEKKPQTLVLDAPTAPAAEARLDAPDDGAQRRDFVRVDASLTVYVRLADELQDDRELKTKTLNVSANGMLLDNAYDLSEGSQIVVELELDADAGGPPVEARGRVVREVRPGVKGVVIESIAPADRERLVRYVTLRERERLRSRAQYR